MALIRQAMSEYYPMLINRCAAQLLISSRQWGAFSVLLLSACSVNLNPFSDVQEQSTSKATLASVYFAPMPLIHDPLPNQGIESLRDAYLTLQNVVSDPATLRIVQYRLADLEVLLAEQRQEKGLSSQGQDVFDNAIAQYQLLLTQNTANSDNAEVLYQLAKAYDLQGQSEQSFDSLQTLLGDYPDNPYLDEVYFRLGEIAFNRSDYPTAIESYRKVVDIGGSSNYFLTSAYMLGWSHFKIEQQQEALLAFNRLLDFSLPNDIINADVMQQVDSQAQVDRLAVGEKRLVNDSIRIMALLFSYQGGAESLVSYFEQQGARHYEYLLYDQLAQQYLNNNRYRDSALVYQTFAQTHPLHHQAPLFAVKQIDAYILGKFPSLVLPAKQAFVATYGIKGEYWTKWGQLMQEKVSPYIHEYLKELAQFEHSRGQLLSKASAEAKAGQHNIDAAQIGVAELQRQNANLARQAFTNAALWYREFIETFPHDPEATPMTFDLAESLYESGNYADAIAAYETYAYEFLDPPKAAEAGYAAILSYVLLRNEVKSPEEQTRWQDKQLLSQSYFVSKFYDDPRAMDVQYDSIQQLFTLKRYALAIREAQSLLAWPGLDKDKILACQLVIAHSQFALNDFIQSEDSYAALLSMLPADDQRFAAMQERLAASIYKQGEANVALGYLPLAVEDFLRVIAKTPNASIRVNAQYDAATYLLELKNWSKAADYLQDFRSRFPSHPLTATVQDKLIVAYQESQDYKLAADELLSLWQAHGDSEQGRQALYVAAQYYEQVGNRQQALESYRHYAHQYPQPFAEAMEARYKLSEFYLSDKDDSKRRFWLNKIIQADATAGKQASPRSRYLAAMSSMVFADDALYQFKQVKLTLPLQSSLKKKKAALTKALAAYDETLKYQVAEFTTAANFKIAEIYHQLARDLLASSKPKGLNALELEQYDILLEEQAYPFEEKAIELHETNARRSWQKLYDSWVQKSFEALSELLPGRYAKQEKTGEFSDEIY
jgi:TolA-binding protein